MGRTLSHIAKSCVLCISNLKFFLSGWKSCWKNAADEQLPAKIKERERESDFSFLRAVSSVAAHNYMKRKLVSRFALGGSSGENF